MSRLLAVLLFLSSALAVHAQEAGSSLAGAMQSLREGNWAAAQITARGDGQIAVDIILWHALRAGRGDSVEVQDFIARNPDWPGMPFLREKSEVVMAETSHAEVKAFFEDYQPQTGAGALALARAHMAEGQEGLAQADIVLAWLTLSMSGDERRVFLETWGQILGGLHATRLDMALWKGWSQNARAMLPYVDEGWQALAEARMALRSGSGNVDTLIENVPEVLRENSGLAYERFLWRVKKGRRAEAIDLLKARSASLSGLGEPWAWARERRDLARRTMRAGRHAEAYEIASRHYLVEGRDYADLEWLSGYLALRFLNQPEQAAEHFRNVRGAVWTPISIGRAGYWLGRAEEALGNTEAAQAAYADGAAYQTSFYGLLAAERGGLVADPLLSGTEAFPAWAEAEFVDTGVYKAAILLLAAGEMDLAERFLTHLAESLDREGIGQLGAMLVAFNLPHIQVMLGKRAARLGLELAGPYYALHSQVTETDYPVPKELVLAIARRESEFDPEVISGAGARGFMQLMPGTAREMAGDLGLDYDSGRLLSDPAYNATLGSTYLAELSEMFDGNAVMMAAGYNAGPSRPNRWMELFGDPRQGAVDVIDWIEFIPFDETRNYVMRVTESLPVYRARLGQAPHPVPFSEELVGRTMPVLAMGQ